MRGFTLIETIVYTALLGLMMTGALLVAYDLLESSGKTGRTGVVAEEWTFVLRKISWALNGSGASAAITSPASGAYGAVLALTRTDGTQVRIRQTGSAIEMSVNGGSSYTPLTTSNVRVGSLQFYHAPASGSLPAGVVASTTVGAVSAATSTFSITRYFRK